MTDSKTNRHTDKQTNRLVTNRHTDKDLITDIACIIEVCDDIKTIRINTISYRFTDLQDLLLTPTKTKVPVNMF